MKNSRSDLAQQLLSILTKFRWQDYGYFAMTAYLGSLAASGMGWFFSVFFLLLLYFSVEKIYRIYQKKDKDGFQYYCDKAQRYHKSGDFNQAVTCISKGLAIGSKLADNSNLHAAYLMRAHSYLMLNDHEAAIKDCTSAIKVDPSQSQAYHLRSLAKFHRKSDFDDFEKDLKKAVNLGNKSAAELLESISSLKSEPTFLDPGDNLDEWRIAQAIVARNAAYIQAYEKYIELLGSSDAIEVFKINRDQLYDQYFKQIEVSSRYKDAYVLFRLRNITYACMAINMHGQSLEDKEAFKNYFLHPIFEQTDTRLREILSEEEIQEQFDRANELEQYIVYGCSIYCNKLLNLIDGGAREERDKGENLTTFLEIQSSLEKLEKIDEIYVVREAMLWTIASTNLDLLTSTEDSDAFEVKAFDLLSKTNQLKSDYGNGPYRKEDIIKAVVNRWEWGYQLALNTESISSSKYQEKLLAMTDTELSAEAVGKDSSLDMRNFLNRWGQSSQVRYGIDELRQAVINDYAYLCYKDGGTQPDEASLADYKKSVEAMSIDKLVSETSVIETSEFKNDELIDYMELWLKYSEYADYSYEQTSEGGTILKEVKGED